MGPPIQSSSQSNTYINIPSSSDQAFHHKLEVETDEDEVEYKSISYFFKRAIWVLAGSTLIGFALCTLWWDPVISTSSDSKLRTQLQDPQSIKSFKNELRDQAIDQESDCNPFLELGYLHYNQTDDGENTWRPFRSDCPTSNLFKQLKDNLRINSSQPPDEALKWITNRTVVLIGDSIDRWHLFDFCNMLNQAPGSTEQSQIFLTHPPAHTFYIGADSPLSPSPWHFDRDDPLKPPPDWPTDDHELFKTQAPIWQSGKINANTTRPRVCRIERYGFTMVNLFNWGLDPKEGGRLYANASGYYPPAEYTSRVKNILKPLLKNLSQHYQNPKITKPDLIEMSSGFWDLRQWGEEDFKRIGAQPNSWSPIAFTDLDQERLDWWSDRMESAVKNIDQSFPESQTPILWRSLHHTQRHYWVAFSRVFQLDQLARFKIQELKTHQPRLRSRLRIDESGALMLGQEHHFRDVLHVAALPGGVLWADIMLWELKRAVQKRGYTHYDD